LMTGGGTNAGGTRGAGGFTLLSATTLSVFVATLLEEEAIETVSDGP